MTGTTDGWSPPPRASRACCSTRPDPMRAAGWWPLIGGAIATFVTMTGITFRMRSGLSPPRSRSAKRLDVVRFVVGDRELEVAWDLAVEIRDRCIRADDPFAREVAARMRAVGATRPVT